MNKIIGGALLMAGTCIGAGMLALPVAMAASGFFLSILLLILCWVMMFYTGLLTLEANINLPLGANFISMSKATLGKTGESITWACYLLLLYSLIAAYLSAGGDLLNDASKSLFNLSLPDWFASLPLIIIIAVFIYSGAKFVDYFSRVLMIGLVASYAALIAIAVPHVNINQLTIGHAKYLFPALAIVIAAFGYHVIIPSLRMYLQDDVGKLKKAIFLGSLIPLLVYIVWELIVFGIIPVHGPYGLLMVLKAGDPASRLTKDLAIISTSNLVTISARFFVVFAIASSFLGIAFSLFDFLADGFKIKKTPSGKSLLLLLTFLPPFIFVLLYPRGFLIALSYAGIFVAILHGILPTLMVWIGREKGLMRRYEVIGGKVFLSIILLFSLLVIISNFKFFL